MLRKKEICVLNLKLINFFVLVYLLEIYFFAWLPNPELVIKALVKLFPYEWFTYYFSEVMIIPYFVLGLLLEVRSVLEAKKNDEQKSIMDSISNVFFIAVIINVAEAGQYFIENRFPDIFQVFQRIFEAFFGIVSMNIILLVWFLVGKLKVVLFQKGKVF